MRVDLRLICTCELAVICCQSSRGGGDALPVLINHSPSSLTLTHELASSNSKSCNSSMRFANSASCFKLRFRLRISQSGSGRAVEEPAMVYTGTAEFVESFMVVVFRQA